MLIAALNEQKTEIRVQFNDVTSGIFKDIPTYLVEFKHQENNLSYEHCVNHTSTLGVKLLMCMVESTSSSVDFLFDICNEQFTGKPCHLGSENATNATMYINKANVTMVVNILNQTLLDALPVTTAPYTVNTSALFAAYTAPLTYSLINFSVIGDADIRHKLPTDFLIHINGTNLSSVADDWVDSAFYALKDFVKPQAYHQRVYGFLAHALATNSRKFHSDHDRWWRQAEQKTVLSVSPISRVVFTIGQLRYNYKPGFVFVGNEKPSHCV